MSNIFQKAKDVITGESHTNDPHHTTDSTHRGTTTTGVGSTNTDIYEHDNRNAGPHRSDMANKLDPRVDSDRDSPRKHGTAGVGSGIGMVGGFGTQHDSSNYGPHDSNIGNKLDPRVDSDQGNPRRVGTGGYSGGGHNTSTDTSGTTSLGHVTGAPAALNQPLGSSTHHTTSHTTGSTNAGPHDSNLMNKLDPRVDSDRDGSRNMGMTGAGGVHNSTGSTTSGPHRTDIGNKLDPKVDSDQDGSHSKFIGGTSAHNTYNTHSTGLESGAHTATGPHSSDIANKLDPRVNSDRDGRGVNTGTYGTGLGGAHNTYYTGLGGAHHNTDTTGLRSGADATSGTHSSDIANKLDPRIDSNHSTAYGSDTTSTTGPTGAFHQGTSTGITGSVGASTGPAPNTAGPHKSDLLNKLDPRVDSDLDGSKTIGGNKSFSNTSGSTTGTHTSTGTGAGTGAGGRFT